MHSSRLYGPQVFRLSSSVGVCGTNNPDEVKALHSLIKNAGYSQATGRVLTINGRCDSATSEAIIWYQRLLNISPSGLVQPTDTWFMQALNSLFGLAYQVKLSEAQNLYGRVCRNIPNSPTWEQLEQKVRDVIIDIFYQGVHNARALFQSAIEGKTALIAHIRNSPTYMSFENHRHRIRYLQ